jgi:hypothetical protein
MKYPHGARDLPPHGLTDQMDVFKHVLSMPRGGQRLQFNLLNRNGRWLVDDVMFVS